MDNFSKDDIDFIFKKGTDKQEFPFKESSWDNMEELLDAEDKKRAYQIYIFSGLAALFIGVSFFFGINHLSTDNRTQKTVNTSTVLLNDEGKIINTQENKINLNPVIKIEDNTPQKKNQKAKQQENTTPIIAKKDIARINQTKSSSPKTSINKVDLSTTSNISNNDKVSLLPVTSTNREEINSSTDIYPNNSQIIATNSEDKIENKKLKTALIANSIPLIALNKLSYNKEPIIPNKISLLKTNTNRFAYQALFAYETSYVKGSANRKSGFKLGAEVAYQFANKFQISSGISVSFKKYETEGVNYSPVQARLEWFDDVPPETVRGKCTVIEIPVEFTYYLKGYRENGFFVGAGINSYFLANEWYDFDFDPAYQDLNKAFWTTENNDNADMKKHFLSVVSAQVGYQRQVSKKLAFQIAPYLQLPLTGIGYGDVKLISTGIQLKMSFAK